jgi:hypothetical protein
VGEIYLILYNLFTGRLSLYQMHGPIGIVNAAVKVSNQGFAPLLFFLAYLSINLAVLNFLPIPVSGWRTHGVSDVRRSYWPSAQRAMCSWPCRMSDWQCLAS